MSQYLQPKVLFPSLTVGLVIGIQNAILALAFAVMIFSGDLAPYVAIGITILFVGSIIHSVVAALGSSLPGMISVAQDSPAVIMAVIAVAILAAMPDAGPETKLYTVLAAMMFSSLLTGLVYLLLGKFKLGVLVSYMPFSVVGGFLAGAGMLLVLGALQVLTGQNVGLLNLAPLFQQGAWLLWAPGVIFAVVLFALVMKVNHYLVLPGVLLVSGALFYLALTLSGISIPEALSGGWLVSGIPQDGNLFMWWNPAGFAQVDWPVLFGQTGGLLACSIISLLGLLLNITGLSLSTGQEIDLNAELKNSGWANLLSAAAASSAGYPTLGPTSLAYRLGARYRLNGLIIALVVGLTLAVGGSFLGFFPNFILGGLLFFIGLDFLYSWLYRSWFNMSRLDFGVVALIAVLINTIGFLEGVTVGMGLAIVLFVAQYSRTPSIRHTLTGVSYQSNVTRSRLHAQLLRRKGDWLHILELQGFIFFGTANQILEKVRARLTSSSESHPPRFIILDFRLVTGFDASAAFSFAKILRLLQARDIHLVLTHLTPQMQSSLAKDLPPGRVHYFKDLDHGLEWCENEMAASFESAGLVQDEASLYEQLTQAMPNPQAVKTLQGRLTHSEANPGECIIRQGDPQCGLYMIESGRVTIYLETDEGGLVRLRSLGAGSFFGEMGVYTRQPASANVTADQTTHFYHLSSTDLEHLENSAPDVAAALHRFVAAYLSERLAKMTATVQSLLH